MIPVPARPVLSLARVEAGRLARSILVLGGLLAGGVVVWIAFHRALPVWWNSDWQIGYGQVVLSLTVLMTAHLATGRAGRDGLAELYASFPSSAGRRTLAHLIGVLGAVPACLVLVGAAVGVLEARQVSGSPDLEVLLGGVLLVLAAGAIGVAVGSRFPHPLAGVLGAFVWFVPFSQSNRFSGAVLWLYPWVKPPQLGELPGPLGGYPPTISHDVELAAILLLAGCVALAIAAAGRRHLVRLIVGAAMAVVVIVAAGVAQLQPISTRNLDHLVADATTTGVTQSCPTSKQVHYCLYPGFASQLSSLETPVTGVLARIPALPASSLTISQYGLTIDDATLVHGQPQGLVDGWRARIQEPPNVPSSTALFVDLATWGVGGTRAADNRFDLALGAAEWAVGLPTNTGGEYQATRPQQCVPLNQAREAIAVWLAGRATHLPSTGIQATGGGEYSIAPIDGSAVVTWIYPGEIGGLLASPGPQITAAGYVLAQAMTKLPEAHVAGVLRRAWGTWINPRTTDSQLAGALGIALPPVNLVGPRGQPITPALPGGVPSQPVCSS
jgi:hypothetical protein